MEIVWMLCACLSATVGAFCCLHGMTHDDGSHISANLVAFLCALPCIALKDYPWSIGVGCVLGLICFIGNAMLPDSGGSKR